MRRVRIMLDLSPAKIADRRDRFAMSENEIGQLRTPLTRNRLASVPWALDNGCFGGILPPAWRRMLGEARETAPLFVAVPDVVGSARRTMELWQHFHALSHGVPLALVLQDGIGDVDIPWDELHAVFVGGTDAFKLSDEAHQAAAAAKILGKHVHIGRLNTPARYRAWSSLADSCDGSGISRYDHMLIDLLDMMRNERRQGELL